MISHPNLPLIFTGNKTNIDIWAFGCQTLNGELQSYFKDNYLTSLKFNYSGDKLGGVDSMGNFEMWKFHRK